MFGNRKPPRTIWRMRLEDKDGVREMTFDPPESFYGALNRLKAKGGLVFLDPNDIKPPFPIKRVYYLFDTVADRGGHAHRALKEVVHCPKGACTFILDDGSDRTSIRLDSPEKGLFIGPGIWREMTDFTPDCVLVAFASAPYDEADYIRDYGEFRDHLRSNLRAVQIVD